MIDKKPNPLLSLIIVVIGLVLLGAGFFYSKSVSTPAGPAETLAAVEAPAEEATEETVVTSEETPGVADDGMIDVDAALSERILGNPTAPIKISEHASLTCGHCGHFHKETFAKFKEDYIDTGKAYVVFSDFPLNAPALHATMIARCLAADKYYDFTSQLFNEQDKWAYEASYLTYLKVKAESFGMDADHFKACLNNKALQDGIVARITAAQKQWGLSSTPSFVVNNKEVISGAEDYETFSKDVEKAVAKANGDESAPETEPAAEAPEETPDTPVAE